MFRKANFTFFDFRKKSLMPNCAFYVRPEQRQSRIALTRKTHIEIQKIRSTLIWIIEYRIWIVCIDRICIIHYHHNNFNLFFPFHFTKRKSGEFAEKWRIIFCSLHPAKFPSLAFGSQSFLSENWITTGRGKQYTHRKLHFYFYWRKRSTKGNKYDSPISFFSTFQNNIGVGSW